MKATKFLGMIAAITMAIVLLPCFGSSAYADDPVIVESLDGTATPTVRSIAVPYELPTAPDIKLSSTDPVFKAGGPSYDTDATWHYKKSDDTWAIMPADQKFLEGAYRYHVCVMCPDENYTFSDTATLIIDDETWTMIKKEKLSTGIEYALFASPEINLPDEQLDSPGPIKKTGDTLNDYRISWMPVDKAKGYEITVMNTTQGFAPEETTFEVGASTNSYDLKDVFKSLSIRTGHNTFIITVKALAPAGYKDSEPVTESITVYAKWTEIVYTFSKGADGTWTKGSSSGFDLTVNRSIEDDKTFSLFESIEVDGVVIAASNYTAASGSLEVSLNAAFLETLSAGEHAVKVNFSDSSAETTLTIAEAAPKDDSGAGSGDTSSSTSETGAKTGDESPAGLLVGLALAAFIVFACAAYRRRIVG